MKVTLSRRTFIKNSALAGGAIAASNQFHLQNVLAKDPIPDIAVAKGENARKNTQMALESLGGMKNFVHKGDRVVLLPNPQGRQPGTYTNPDVVAETIKMCFEAGAKEVAVCSVHGPGRWQASGIIKATETAGGIMIYPQSDKDWVNMDIPKGKIIKKTKIIKKAVENDVLINMPIAKQHNSTRFTCNLKNLMGFNDDNQSFHKGEEHLQQCIVDLASIFNPDLCIVDANTILLENGPFGPGNTSSPQSVYVGTDMVALDALCCDLIKQNPMEVGHINGAYKLSLGEMNMKKLNIKNVQT